MKSKFLDFDILPQPDDTTCGPTCLQSVYRYFGDTTPINNVIKEVKTLDGGGTLAVMLALHALKKGFKATIYTYNLHIFDPTWFRPGVDLRKKLQAQAKFKKSTRLKVASKAYIDFLKRGGEIRFEDLNAALIRRYLDKSIPILTGLSSTYLYHSKREKSDTNKEDDVRGFPTGHFIVLCGYDQDKKHVAVADPYTPNPLSANQRYTVTMDRLIGAILLGIVTYDANLLIIEPR